MSRRIKELISSELERRFNEVDDVVIVNCAGLTAEESGDFRSTLRDAGASLSVVKNTLAKRVLQARGVELDTECFDGPTAFISGNDDAIACTKIIADWRKKTKKQIAFKGGLLGGKPLSAEDTESLTKMPSIMEAKQMVVSAVAGPLTALVGITSNVLSGVPGVLQAIQEDKEGE